MKQLQFGPIRMAEDRVQWNLWAPRARRATLHLFDESSKEAVASKKVNLTPLKHGFFVANTESVVTGQRYGFSINDGPMRPDPASRWQPDGVHHASAYWDPSEYAWQDHDWLGTRAQELILYELHIGTFTRAGTLRAIIDQLDSLVELGVNAIELMPVAQFPGEFGWGYDGAYWYAVHNSYGGPRALQVLVDQCHGRGLSVILDVVYNHFGPEGNYFGEFAPIYSATHRTPWGDAINFDGSNSLAMRDFVIENALYWIREFHIDGFRLDAVHAMTDNGPEHILRSYKKACQSESIRVGRSIHVIAESNLNDVILLNDPSSGGYGLDKIWNDDFHHCVHTLLTNESNGYYIDFPTPELQLEKVFNHIFAFDGVFSEFLNDDHGKPAGDHFGDRFVASIQTHDQVGNRAKGDRLGTLITMEQQRLAAGLLLLSPFTPMLFMGEEYGEKAGFPFFCDFQDESLKDAVRRGRQKEFRKFQWQESIADPTTRATFESAKLNREGLLEREQLELRSLYVWLLRFRKRKGHLTDRTLLRTELHSLPGGIHILELSRFYDVEQRKLDWAAGFNLSGSTWEIEHCLFPKNATTAIFFRSGNTLFAPQAFDASIRVFLAPYQFFVIEASRDRSMISDSIHGNSMLEHSDGRVYGEQV